MNTENKSFTPKEIKDLWQTPREIFNSLRKEFNFDCDVAASESNALCNNFIDECHDSLDIEALWGLVNWCNPPYSNISPWVEKAKKEHSHGKSTVMLVPSDTSVKWFKQAYESCNEVRFISGRLSFINAETQKPVNGNNKGSVLFIWRGHCESHCVSLIDRSKLMGDI